MAKRDKKTQQSEGLLPQADEGEDMVAEEVSLDQASTQVRRTGNLAEPASGTEQAAADALSETLPEPAPKKLKPAIDRAVPDFLSSKK
ncbi:hypothetical protein [Massilia glaciei]|uniref:Uncharacterized protein n=1 Tax=Massilia glaciei TaxID=1524097 RepID=A0A2U2HMG0_9BURK|nr:hypothetical protein [Massilia glaciei]PWF48683.1 hypothetical protein C7C56_010550 [Massilia glaciei]